MPDRQMKARRFKPISRKRFWDAVGEVPPLLRLGDPEGPGAFVCSEPDELRQCAITGKPDNTYLVYTVRKDRNGITRHFEHREPLTVHEFKVLCDRIMPGLGICAMKWGGWLLDERGNLRTDLKFPIRYPAMRK
jgi:hypothetical protein